LDGAYFLVCSTGKANTPRIQKFRDWLLSEITVGDIVE